MFYAIRKRVCRWSHNPYARFLMLMLLTAAMFLGAMWTSGCQLPSCGNSGHFMRIKGDPLLSEVHSFWWEEKNRVMIQILGGPAGRNIIWMPPPGAANFTFKGAEPEPGGPPFVFKNQGDPFEASYDPPPVPEGQNSMTLTDAFQENYPDGSVGVCAVDTTITSPSHFSSGAEPSLAVPPSRRRMDSSTRRQEEVDMWHLERAIMPGGTPLTTDLCNEWLARLRSDDYFIAFRMPMATAAPTMSYRLPFVFGTPYSQTLSLRETASVTPLLTIPLEYRLERLHFLGNALPSAEGEHWAALGLSTDSPASCPEGLDLAVGGWDVLADLIIDLHDQPDDCEGCMLRYYYCYEGQASPFGEAATTALARTMGVETYQDEGITCLGPKTLAVPSASRLYLSGSESAYITPTQRIELHEHLWNWTGGPVTVTLDLTSTVDGWQMYDGDAEEPDLEAPILAGSPISMETGRSQHIWLVSDVPAGTPDGPHALVLSATVPTAPDLSTFDAIPIWCGDWVAPPSCEPITSLFPDGPPTTTVDASTAFTATVGPPTATLPITYTWQASEQTPVVHASRYGISDTVSFTWEISGTQDVTVTAANGCSEFVSAPRHVDVEEAPEEKRTIYLPLVVRQ